MQKHTWLGVLVASFIVLIICLDWYLYSLLSISVALYLLALGKSHTLNWENKEMSKNLYPQDLNV
jgi:prepilin signal peptidase PulO-like enzyme (type II secretory pathway)